MKKQWIIVIGAILIVANVPPMLIKDAGGSLVTMAGLVSAITGLVMVWLAMRGSLESPQALGSDASPYDYPAAKPTQTHKAADAAMTSDTAATVDAAAPVARAEAELVALLALMQNEGRLIDFIQEDIQGAKDSDLAPVARVVHSGCRKVLQKHFSIEPVSTQSEGSKVVLQTGYPTQQYRLLGSVPETPPYSGTLVHPGWKVSRVDLPELAADISADNLPVLAPAEVEIKS